MLSEYQNQLTSHQETVDFLLSKAPDPAREQVITDVNNRIVACNAAIKSLKEKRAQNCREYLKCMHEHQKALVKANFMAYEAYVNRSAPFDSLFRT